MRELWWYIWFFGGMFLHIIPYYSDKPYCPKLRVTKVKRSGDKLHISFNWWSDEYSGWCGGTGINVDLKDSYASGTFLGHRRGSSGDVGFVLFTFIPAIVLSPAIMLVSYYYFRIENKRGMSRHHAAFLDAIRGQIEPDVYADLERVFKSERLKYLQRFGDASEVNS